MTSLDIYFNGNYNHYKGDTREEQDYWSDAISYNRQLEEKYFNGKHKYRLEWDVPDKEAGTDGYLRWFLDDELVMRMDGKGITGAGFGAEITSEPSYILFNTAISSQWGEFELLCLFDPRSAKVISASRAFVCQVIFALHLWSPRLIFVSQELWFLLSQNRLLFSSILLFY